MSRLIVQNAAHPASIRHSIVDLMTPATTEIRVASAYVTHSGSELILGTARRVLGAERFAAIPKLLLTSLDFGLTDPRALRDWLDLENTNVLVSGQQRLEQGSLIPATAFHPKVYAFGRGDRFCVLVGSANLTGRGFSVNTESSWVQHDVRASEIYSVFRDIRHDTVPLSERLLESYLTLRQSSPPSREIGPEADPVATPEPVAGDQLPVFRAEIEDRLDPLAYNEMWIQVERLQGGSASQLELPRGGHRFFGLDFDRYDYLSNLTIGQPLLRSGARSWEDRPLTWHGNNRMERLNLPTRTQGGFTYSDSAVMFRRLPDGFFELIVEAWESDLARAWRHASAQRQLLFRLGERSTSRLVGLV